MPLTITQAAILGLVQGLTEFLPVSSTAHLILVPRLMGFQDPGLAFDMALHMGTLVAVALEFWKDLWGAAKGGLRLLVRRDLTDPEQRLAAMLVIGTIPAGVIGLLAKKKIETVLRDDIRVIAAALIVVAIAILLVERLARHARPIEDTGVKDAVLVGCGQACALVPGVSRSGSTMAVGLALGLTREASARLSFLIGFPTILAACLVKAKELLKAGATPGEPPATFETTALVVGVVVSAVTGWLVIRGLLAFLRTRTFLVFAVYRIALGIVLLALWLSGSLPAS